MSVLGKSRIHRYFVVGVASLVGLVLAEQVIKFDFVPELFQLVVFYLLVPGWTLMMAYVTELSDQIPAPLD